MTTQSIIIKKQKGKEISAEEIDYLINGYVAGKIPDYQVAAFLMAVYFQGMTNEEIYYLTATMLNSGERIDTRTIPGMKVDKHSTGGVGDKVSLILAPLLATAGVSVPMISGRGLGHSGGTLDKLDSIPGFRTDLTIEQSMQQLSKIGVVLIGQTERLVPADKKIYALRDSTATVRSIPLITASILSKKLAEGIDALVIDLKVGKGAFFKDQPYAFKLADKLINISDQFNLKTSVIFTGMNQPLGRTIGNWLEVEESIETLQGKGPADLISVTLALGAEMLLRAKVEKDYVPAENKLKEILNSGQAFQKFIDIVKSQGGKVKFIEHPQSYDKSKYHYIFESERGGYVSDVDALEFGLLAMDLGAGRKTISDVIDYKAGIRLHKKIGDFVERNEPFAEVFTDLEINEDLIKERILNAFSISPNRVAQPNPLLSYANKEGVFRWPYF